jgi:potassium channel subfamily K
MNDPGLHESAQEAAQDVEQNKHEEDDQAEQEEQEYLDPRYATLRSEVHAFSE